MKVTGQHVPQPENLAVESESDDEEEQQEMIDWALEWRRKPWASIVT